MQIIEIIPPVVETDLHRDQKRRPPRPMALDAFITAAMAGPDAEKMEILIVLAKVLRAGSRIAPAMFLNIVNKQRG